MSKRLAARVALVGCDAADWKVIHPLLDRGLLPNLRSLIERGVMGNLAALHPSVPPMLWTSLATGHTGEQHGVLGVVEPDPVMGTLRPISSSARKTKALWDIASQAGLRSLVVNWPATHPVELIDGVFVSDRFTSVSHFPGSEWPLMPESVWPESLEQTLADFRVSPADLTGNDLHPFLPHLARIDQASDTRPLTLAIALANSITTHAAATWLMENEQWDLLAVRYDLIADISREFMKYHPPQMASVGGEDFDTYGEVVNGAYCFQDMMLGRLIQLAGPDTAILAVSAHGFQTGAQRPAGAQATSPEWHRPYGVLIGAGPGIRHDELVFGGGLLDIAPTVLTLLGIAAGEDMSGRVLAEAFSTPVELERVPTWEDGSRVGGAGAAPWEASAVIDHLISLGYVEPRDEELDRQLETARRAQSFTLAHVHLAAGRNANAIAVLEELRREVPDNAEYRLYLAHAYQHTGRVAECRALLDPLLQEYPDGPIANLLAGNLAVAEGDYDVGLERLLRAEKDGNTLPQTRLAIARVYLHLERWDDVERVVKILLAQDSDDAAAHVELSRALLGKGQPAEAAAAALESVSLRFDNPAAHYALGVALAVSGARDRAIRAFRTCLALNPEMVSAQQALQALRTSVR